MVRVVLTEVKVVQLVLHQGLRGGGGEAHGVVALHPL